MRIKTVKIKNFKCLGPDEITIDFSENIIVLIGENNVGKSAVLSALDYFFSGRKTLPPENFFNNQTDLAHAVIITVTFSNLSAGDKSHQAISSYITTENSEELWIFKKAYYYSKIGEAVCDPYVIVNGEEKINPGGRPQNAADLFTDDKMQKIFIEAVKNVNDVSGSGSKTAFAQVFNLIIRDYLEHTQEYGALIIALEKYSELFQGTAQIQKIKEVEDLINQKLSRIIKAKSKISADPPKSDVILPLPKLLTNDERDVDVVPSAQGHGLQRSIIFTLLEILAEKTSPHDKEIGPRNLLLIEEPEIYMHPQMERKIADTLYEIAASGNTQVICTTHSPIFIRMADKHKALVRLVRKDSNLIATQTRDIFTGSDKESKRKKFRMITNFDPSVNELFFAKRIVLVEGDTEVAIFREAAELLNYFESDDNKHKKRDTTFINCRGKLSVPLFQEVLNHFGIDYVVIHDKDNEDLSEGANGRILSFLNNDESKRMLFSSKIESVIDILDTGKEKPIKALDQIQLLNSQNDLESKLGDFVKFAYGIN